MDGEKMLVLYAVFLTAHIANIRGILVDPSSFQTVLIHEANDVRFLQNDPLVSIA